MKKFSLILTSIICLLAGCSMASTSAQLPRDITPQSVYDVMAKVADWQLNNPSRHRLTDWTHGALFAGMSAWAQTSQDEKYINALLEWGGKTDWKLGPSKYFADDHAVGQMYLEMYSLYKDPKMMVNVKERLDWLLANPSDVTLKSTAQNRKDRWWWCDALFMAPPVWAKLSALTGDSRYLDFMNKEWWATTEYLYNAEEHLYFRDDTMFDKKESNGKNIFWSRGNGWVIGGLVRVLESMPRDYPNRDKYIQLYKQMAAKLIQIQGDDGFWRSSLLYSEGYPAPESSGTAFFCYGLAWGINHGVLDESTYLPAVVKAWQGLQGNINQDGKLGFVQQIGLDPRHTTEDQTEIYGVGAFLLAGCEVYKIAMRNGGDAILVRTTNPSVDFREAQTISLGWSDILKKNKSLTNKDVSVFDFKSNRFIVTQTVDNDGDGKTDELLFQTKLAPGQQKWFWVMNLPQGAARPETKECAYGRHVPERYSDFAWENDRIAFRMYAKELEWETVSPGIDVWVKKVRYPIIDNLYKNVLIKKTYHTDNGEGLDYYKVGPTLGCGGLGILAGDKLIMSRNYTAWRQFANGPIRILFELSYDAWDAGGVKVTEVKRISLDKGSNLNRIESRMTCDSQKPLTLGAGIVVRSDKEGQSKLNPDEKWISYWFAPDKENGMTGCSVVLTPDTKAQLKEQNDHLLAIVEQPCGEPFVYYTGACWERGLDFKTADQWDACLSAFAKQLENPVIVTLEK